MAESEDERRRVEDQLEAAWELVNDAREMVLEYFPDDSAGWEDSMIAVDKKIRQALDLIDDLLPHEDDG